MELIKSNLTQLPLFTKNYVLDFIKSLNKRDAIVLGALSVGTVVVNSIIAPDLSDLIEAEEEGGAQQFIDLLLDQPCEYNHLYDNYSGHLNRLYLAVQYNATIARSLATNEVFDKLFALIGKLAFSTLDFLDKRAPYDDQHIVGFYQVFASEDSLFQILIGIINTLLLNVKFEDFPCDKVIGFFGLNNILLPLKISFAKGIAEVIQKRQDLNILLVLCNTLHYLKELVELEENQEFQEIRYSIRVLAKTTQTMAAIDGSKIPKETLKIAKEYNSKVLYIPKDFIQFPLVNTLDYLSAALSYYAGFQSFGSILYMRCIDQNVFPERFFELSRYVNSKLAFIAIRSIGGIGVIFGIYFYSRNSIKSAVTFLTTSILFTSMQYFQERDNQASLYRLFYKLNEKKLKQPSNGGPPDQSLNEEFADFLSQQPGEDEEN